MLHSRAVAALPIAAVLLILALGTLRRGSLVEEIRDCHRSGCFDAEAAGPFEPVIAPLLRGTPYEGRLNLREPPSVDHLNVYFANADLPGRLRTIACNCAFVGAATIICDQRFLRSFSRAVDYTPDSFYGRGADEAWHENGRIFRQANAQVSGVLLSWILAHEIGHAVLHAGLNLGRRRAVTEEHELQADTFFAEQVFRDADQRTRQQVYAAVSNFVFALIGVAFRPAAEAGGRGTAVIAPSADQVHQPWLVRALRLGQELTERERGPERDNDFYKSLAGHVVVAPGGLEIGSFCDYENLRDEAARRQQAREPGARP